MNVPAGSLVPLALDTLYQHIPALQSIGAYAGLAGAGIGGLILLLYGARLLPGLMTITFVLGGGALGAYVSRAFGVPLWPSVAVAGLGCGAIGYLFTRLWIASLLGATLVSIGLITYYAQSLTPHVDAFLHGGAQDTTVTLRPAGEVQAERASPSLVLIELRDYLGKNVPGFYTNITLIAVLAGLAGLVFGILLPLPTRALWSATAGSLLLLVASTGLLRELWPAGLQTLSSFGSIGWVVVGAVWLGSLLFNLRDGWPKKVVAAEAEPAPAVPAKA
jgi:hypothetical protein